MSLSGNALKIFDEISGANTKLGDLRKIAKEIKRDHELAMELWSTRHFMARQLAMLIMDKRLLTQEAIDTLCEDISDHEYDERNQLTDWLLANQLAKDKKTKTLMESWENSSSAIQRRIFWYYQARLRWVGQSPPENTPQLLDAIEAKIEKEEPEVQWAMNFTAGWIGIHQAEYRKRCVAIGANTGLFKDEKVSRGCTPNYLPEFIRIEAAKVNK